MCHPVLEGWISGNFDFFDYQRPIELLRKGVIDTWVGSYPDIPDHDNVEIASIRLNRIPMHLLVSPSHPLLNLGNSITMDDVARYPSLALPEGAFPKFQAIATQCGIWNTPAKVIRFKQEDWYGRMDNEELIVAYGTPLTIGFLQQPKVIPPIRLPLEVGDARLVHRPFLQAGQT